MMVGKTPWSDMTALPDQRLVRAGLLLGGLGEEPSVMLEGAPCAAMSQVDMSTARKSLGIEKGSGLE